nr:hypothetical protein [Crucivirus sp.]
MNWDPSLKRWIPKAKKPDKIICKPDGCWMYFGKTGQISKEEYENMDKPKTFDSSPGAIAIRKAQALTKYYARNNYGSARSIAIRKAKAKKLQAKYFKKVKRPMRRRNINLNQLSEGSAFSDWS